MPVSIEQKATNLILEGRIDENHSLRVYDVQGFRGNDYHVVVSGNEVVSCTCPAYGFGNRCYHRIGVEGYLMMQSIEEVEMEDEEVWGP